LLRKGKRGRLETGFWRATVHRHHIAFRPTTRDPQYNEREKFTVPRQGIHDSEDMEIAGLLCGAGCRYEPGPPKTIFDAQCETESAAR